MLASKVLFENVDSRHTHLKTFDLSDTYQKLTSHPDSEAAGSFVPRSVEHCVGQLMQPLWEV